MMSDEKDTDAVGRDCKKFYSNGESKTLYIKD